MKINVEDLILENFDWPFDALKWGYDRQSIA